MSELVFAMLILILDVCWCVRSVIPISLLDPVMAALLAFCRFRRVYFVLRSLSLLSVLLLPVLFPASAFSPDTWTPAGAGLSGYNKLVFNDEFSGSSLDRSKWFAHDTAWEDNGELEYYSPNAVSTANGLLEITASAQSVGGRNYMSGRIDTSQSQLFIRGLFAARIRFPQGKSIWPSWWMFGAGVKYAEFDIAEMAGAAPGHGNDGYGALAHYSSVYRPTDQVSQGPATVFHAPAGEILADDFHVMWMEWTSSTVTMGFDNQAVQIMADVSQHDAYNDPMFLIFNVAVGGYYPGAPDSTTVFPQTMYVDWVRVWQRDSDGNQFTVVPPKGTGGELNPHPTYLPYTTVRDADGTVTSVIYNSDGTTNTVRVPPSTQTDASRSSSSTTASSSSTSTGSASSTTGAGGSSAQLTPSDAGAAPSGAQHCCLLLLFCAIVAVVLPWRS
jgi:beta-glucanase (GH16 family)